MNHHLLYAAIDIGCLIVPLLASFHPAIGFYREWRYFIPVSLNVAVLFIGWDILFTHLGVWSFNPDYISGYYFCTLPIEEIAFFICIPYACNFTYYCFRKFVPTPFTQAEATKLAYLLSAILAAVGLYHVTIIYTSVTFLLLAALLFFTARHGELLKYFFVAYAVNLMPFFISNGLLTGSWITQPIVLYNSSYNLGIRIGTIPLEDFFYGMLFQWANVWGFYFIKKQKVSRKNIDKE